MAKKKAQITTVDFPSWEPVTITELIDAPACGNQYQGRVVKFAPDVPAERRESFDAAGYRAAFLEAAAVGVVVAPRFVGVAKTREVAQRVASSAATSPQAAFEAWLAEVRGVPQPRLEKAKALFASISVGGKP